MMRAAVLLTLLAVLQPASSTVAVNIARFGKATQSSLYTHGLPENAIDGNLESNYGRKSCACTNKDESPWWRLDLLRTYRISTITITNRGDCCPERLNGAEIRIGNSLKNNGNANPRCVVIASIPGGTSKTYQCGRFEGRYINILLPGRKDYLTICEVQVTGYPADTTPPAVNLARRGTAVQSSRYSHGMADRAIDGNRISLYSLKSCSHTNREKRPWWRLDLSKTHKINTIVITNRGDCCSKRLHGAEIRIGDSLTDNGNANPRCAVISSDSGGLSQTFVCQGMKGRYVNIVIPDRAEYLALCEVEVYGEPADGSTPEVNLARAGIPAQSSTWGGQLGVPDRAIDGRRASIWNRKSCSHTQNNKSPWWRVDLLKTAKVSRVVVTNRGDCCHTQLDGAEIRIGDSLDDNGNCNPRCAVISSLKGGISQSFSCNGMEGRYVNIVIPGKSRFLTLCEVEVYGLPSDGSTPSVVNVARGKTVAQSSVHQYAVAERAVDGNMESAFSLGSCSQTLNDQRPWWRVDLLKTHKVSRVVITSRGDCCPKRLDGAEIRIGESLNDNGNANPRCTVITNIPQGTSRSFSCNGMEGRFVNIVIPGRKEYLALCEVEVFGEALGGENVVDYVCE